MADKYATAVAAEHLTRASTIAGDLETFAPDARNHKGGSQAYVQRQARRLQIELNAAARALGMRIE